MTAQRLPSPETAAPGPRSVVVDQNSGVITTGDHTTVHNRTVVLGTGIPRPSDVEVKPGLNNLPRPPVRVFVGRNVALRRLKKALSDRAAAVVTQAVYGLGGVGKSELA